ncbi:hypothetical protein GY45DRAFT_1315752 [Cubamyces sp. BRFM 1775]|nr:hypothetical protein GY45DRAFT_1315752 [Cubamyces sp. BRFM 1775]
MDHSHSHPNSSIPPPWTQPHPTSTQLPDPGPSSTRPLSSSVPPQPLPTPTGQPYTTASVGLSPGTTTVISTQAKTDSQSAGNDCLSETCSFGGNGTRTRHTTTSSVDAGSSLSTDIPTTIPAGSEGTVTSSGSHRGTPSASETVTSFSTPGASIDGLTLSTSSPAINGQDTGGRSNDGRTRGSSPTGPIVGAVIGGIALAFLVACIAIFLLRRRKRARHTAPSAEFMDIMRHGGVLGPGGALSPTKQDGRTTTPGHHYYSNAAEAMGGDASSEGLMHPLDRKSSLESDERPPAFTPGAYRDPVLEKVRTAAAMREHYLRRESLSAMARDDAARLDRRGSESDHGWQMHEASAEETEYAWAM